jgi:hypothetical protein
MSGAFASVNADSDAPLVAPRAFHPVVAPSSSVSSSEDQGDIYVSAKFLGADDDALVRVLINANVGSSVSVSADGFPDTLVPLSALVSLQIPVLTTPPQRGRGRGRCGQRGVSSSTPSLPSFGRGRVIDIAHRASKDIERIAQPRSMGRAPITARVSISDRVYEGHERLEHPTHLAPKDGVWAACERITRPQIVHIHRR